MLAQAARDARLDQIDSLNEKCGDRRRVEDWLKQLVEDAGRSVRWSGGRCQIVNKLNPIDAGTGWCGRAAITPKAGGIATIEVFFERGENGKPGRPFAFRGTPNGPEFVRHPVDFERAWKALHVPGYSPPADSDCD
ncbi:MAG: hypothetical protein GC182_11650 [Rhodopseudomonas sp.]|nr:hypothetical protein [Rhodopseudomonas sp.]